jgi:hypothetical protein
LGIYKIYEALRLTATGKFGREKEYASPQIKQKKQKTALSGGPNNFSMNGFVK